MSYETACSSRLPCGGVFAAIAATSSHVNPLVSVTEDEVVRSHNRSLSVRGSTIPDTRRPSVNLTVMDDSTVTVDSTGARV